MNEMVCHGVESLVLLLHEVGPVLGPRRLIQPINKLKVYDLDSSDVFQ